MGAVDIASVEERAQEQRLNLWTPTEQGVTSHGLASEYSSQVLGRAWIERRETGTL